MREDGMTTLQSLDAGATKSLLSDGDGYLRKKIVEEEAQKIAEKVNEDLAAFFVDGLSMDMALARQASFKQCATILLKLKFEMMLANKDYKLHFIEAGTEFLASMMTAVDGLGKAIRSKPGSKVRFCVYPAWVQYDAQSPSDVSLQDFSAVLLCNKSFFPDEVDRASPVVVARAMVLLE
jgi:hypothetical protein